MSWVVFDYGEVICRRTTALPELAARLGVEQTAFEPAYWSLRDPYDRGSSDLEYWQAVGEALGVAVDQSTADALTEIDVAGWSHTEPATVGLLEKLANNKVSLALLSNASVSFARYAEQQPWTRHFNVLLFSGDFGVAKPDPAIYTALLSRLGVAAADCVFFDDRQSNVDGAKAMGLRAHPWHGVDDARTHLRI